MTNFKHIVSDKTINNFIKRNQLYHLKNKRVQIMKKNLNY